MGNTELILDVQLRVLTFADKRTICQLMQTCRTLNHYGAKALLAWGPVCLDTESKQAVLSFLQFLARDPLYRLSHFHWLELTRSQDSQWPTVQAEEVGPLLESLFLLLARHGSLQVLTIDDIEVVLDLKTDLSSAISMVGTLKDIHLALIASRGANMLMMSRSTLGDADLSMDGIYEDDEDSEDEDSEEDSEPFRLDDRKLSHILHGSQHSLHSLTVSGYGLRGAHIGPRYPRMANLAHLFPDMLRTRSYVHAFPNLRTLKVMHWIDSDDLSTPDDLDELRSENEREQAQYGAWSSLWKFDGSIPTLFLLAPPCHIHALEITDDYDLREVPSKALDMLLSCVDVAHPRHISLTSYNGRWMSDPAFLSAWSRPALQSLVHLQLVFSLRPNYGDDQEPGPEVDLARGLDNLVAYIVSAVYSLRSFSLSLDAAHASSKDPSPVAVRPLGALERTLEEWDMDAFARRVRTAGASGPLESVAVRICGHRTRAEQTVQLGPVYKLGEMPSAGEGSAVGGQQW